MSDETSQTETPKYPLPWAPMAGVAAIWIFGWFTCSLDISTPFPDISAGEVCAVAPGIGLKWTDLLLAIISGIIAAGWAESRMGPGTSGSGRHVRKHHQSDVNARLWFMTGFGSYFIFATFSGIALHMSIRLFYSMIGLG